MMTHWLELLLSNLVVAGALAVLAVALPRLWRSPQLAHALWLIVLIKLVTPPLVRAPLPWSLGPPTGAERLAPVPNRDEADSLGRSGVARRSREMELIGAAESYAGARRSDSAERAARSNRSIDRLAAFLRARWQTCLLAAWACGAAVFLTVVARRHRWAARLVAESREPGGALLAEASEIAPRLGLARAPTVRLTPARVSPLVVAGCRRPVVLLPEKLLARLTPEQTRTVLAHEMAHLRRGDHLARWVELVVLTAHWWNPLAWLASHQMRRAEEACCDAWVVWAMPESRRGYGEALLRAVDFLTESAVPARGMAFGRFLFKRRIEMIMRGRTHHRISWLGRVAVLAIGLCTLPVAATGMLQESEETAERGDRAAVSEENAGGQRRAIEDAAPSAETGETAPPTGVTVADQAEANDPNDGWVIMRFSLEEDGAMRRVGSFWRWLMSNPGCEHRDMLAVAEATMLRPRVSFIERLERLASPEARLAVADLEPGGVSPIILKDAECLIVRRAARGGQPGDLAADGGSASVRLDADSFIILRSAVVERETPPSPNANASHSPRQSAAVFAARLKLAELKIDAASAEASRAKQKYELTLRLKERDYVSDVDLYSSESEYERAQIALQRAKLEMELLLAEHGASQPGE